MRVTDNMFEMSFEDEKCSKIGCVYGCTTLQTY